MFFENRDVLAAGIPFHGFMPQHTAAHALALPIDAWVGQRPVDKVVHDIGDSFFAAQAVVERFFRISRLAIAFTFAVKLLLLCYALLGALVGLAASGSVKLFFLALVGHSAASQKQCRQDDRRF